MTIEHVAPPCAPIAIINPDTVVPKDHLAQFDALDMAHSQERDYRAKRAVALRPTPDERAALTKAMGTKAQAVPLDFQETLATTTKLMWDRAGSISAPPNGILGGFFGLDPSVTQPVPPVDHRFWWHRHNWNDNQRGLSIRSTPQGFEFAGVADHSTGEFTQFDMGVSSIYALEKDRRQYSPTGWYHSAPRVNLSGFIQGQTGLRWPIITVPFLGDYWCSCTLHLRQTVFELNTGPNNRSLKLGESNKTIPVFKLENDYPFGSATFECPGQIEMPEVQFHPNGNRATYVNHDVRFVIVQEGKAKFEFKDVFLNMDQWLPEVIR